MGTRPTLVGRSEHTESRHQTMPKQPASNTEVASETADTANAADVEDFFRPLGNEVAVPQSPSSVVMRLPNGGLTPMTQAELKQLTFADLNNMPVVTADDTIGEEQFGPILENKDRLVDKPFVIVHWQFHTEGTFGTFVTMYIIDEDDQHYIVNDGSTGISQQLQEVTAKHGIDSMLVCEGGFRFSEYEKELPNGKVVEAKTYYIAASKRIR